MLFFSLLGMIGIAYIFANRTVLSPWVIGCAMFLVSTVFAMLNVNKWQFTLQPVTVIIILAALACLGAGEMLVTGLFQRFRWKRTNTDRSAVQSGSVLSGRAMPIYVPLAAVVTVALVMCLMLVYYYKETYAFSLAGGNPGGTELMLKYAREAKLSRLAVPGRIYGHVGFLTKALGYIFLYAFVYNTVLFGWKLRWLPLLIPVALYIPFILLSTGRTDFIYVTVVVMMVGCYLYLQKNAWHYRCTFKILLLAVIALAAFFLVFVLSGLLTGKVNFSNAYNSISFYTGLSIPSLDYWIQNPLPDTPYIGNHTLIPMYSTLRTLGFDLPDLYAPYEFVQFNGTSGNVYTAIRRYMEDFTVVGMLGLFFLLGALYSFLFNWMKNRNSNGFLLLVYAAYCYPIFELSIEERFFMNVFSTGSVYLFVYLGVLYYLFVAYPRKRAAMSHRLKERQFYWANRVEGSI